MVDNKILSVSHRVSYCAIVTARIQPNMVLVVLSITHTAIRARTHTEDKDLNHLYAEPIQFYTAIRAVTKNVSPFPRDSF